MNPLDPSRGTAADGPPIAELWVYLGTSPLLWLSLTVASYAGAVRLQKALGGSPFANPFASFGAMNRTIDSMTRGSTRVVDWLSR